MKYTACLVDQCLQRGMMFFDVTAFARIFYYIYWPIIIFYLKQESSVKKSNNNYNSNASVKYNFCCIRVLETLTEFQMKSSTLIELHAHVWRI